MQDYIIKLFNQFTNDGRLILLPTIFKDTTDHQEHYEHIKIEYKQLVVRHIREDRGRPPEYLLD